MRLANVTAVGLSAVGRSAKFMRALFLFQAEDGIRDWSVTGVQTCALSISYAVFCLRSEEDTTELQALSKHECRLLREEIGSQLLTVMNYAYEWSSVSCIGIRFVVTGCAV